LKNTAALMPPPVPRTRGESRFVNLKTRICNDDTKHHHASGSGYRHGVLAKQWRRLLHNIAAADMAWKPEGNIDHIPHHVR
jgi:hypothetical protein